MKEMIMTWYQIRQYPASIWILLARIAEDIILLAVTMKIKTCLYSKFLSRLLYLSFYLIYLGMKYLWWLFPSSVQIYTSDITSKIAIDYSIDVYHRIYQKHTIFKEIINLRSWLHQSFHNTQNHIGRPYFSRMLSS